MMRLRTRNLKRCVEIKEGLRDLADLRAHETGKRYSLCLYPICLAILCQISSIAAPKCGVYMEPIRNSLNRAFLTPRDLQALGLVQSQSTLRNWRKRGEGPAFIEKPHRRYVYPLDSLLEWLKGSQSPWVKCLSSPLLIKILEKGKNEEV